MGERRPDRLLEWAATTRVRPGQQVSGDLAVVSFVPDGALVAAVDGLGYGHEAAHAARIAGDVIRARSGEHLASLARHCHEALVHTRGAAITLVFVSASESTIAWLGIGSVEGRLVAGDPLVPRSKNSLRLARGVAGKCFPSANIATLDVRRGDLVILATDGIGCSFADPLTLRGTPRQIAERIVSDHWKGTDDALVLVSRYLGNR